MRSLITWAAAAALLAACVGCHQTAGYCDCDQPGDPCCYGPTGTGLPGGGYPVPPVESVPTDHNKPMPTDYKDAR